MQMIIKNGHVIDPGNINAIADIHVDNGKIVSVKILKKASGVRKGGADGKGLSPEQNVSPGEPEAGRVIDASGCIVVPGLIDMHVHLREPGEEYKETIESGIRAAAAGGFTSICCMPNTRPVNDNGQVTEFIIQTARQCRSVNVYPVAAISRGLAGKEMCEYGELKEAGAVAISDDGRPVVDSLLMRRALEYSQSVGLKVISHCEDPSLSGGVMNEGSVATRAGLAGIPNAAESIMVMRDIALSELTGVPVHIAHVSARESIFAIRDAKARGVNVTAETAPHYFTLTDNDVKNYDTYAKMNPPLRSVDDRSAVREALSDGTIDVIATDHAPHSILEKDVEFDMAANGIIGLETAVGLSLILVSKGVMSMETLVEKLANNPAKILGLESGIADGKTANFTIIDPKRSHVYHAKEGYSKSKNTPFDGWEFPGKVVTTIVGGEVVFSS
jgi:dihydroorotase